MNQTAQKPNSSVANTLDRLDTVIASAKKTHEEINSHLKAIETENKKANSEIDADILDMVRDLDDALIRLLKTTE